VVKKLAESKIRELTGCSVVAIREEGKLSINPDPARTIKEGCELVIIGSIEGEKKLMQGT